MYKHVDSRAPKVEPKPHAKNPAGVSQFGQAQGNHVTTMGGGKTDYRGDPVNAGRGYQAPYGITDPVKAVGVGGGRTIYKTGTQCQTGPVNPGDPRPVPSGHIISSYGPDKPRS
jgi:hypothetical protein